MESWIYLRILKVQGSSLQQLYVRPIQSPGSGRIQRRYGTLEKSRYCIAGIFGIVG